MFTAIVISTCTCIVKKGNADIMLTAIVISTCIVKSENDDIMFNK